MNKFGEMGGGQETGLGSSAPKEWAGLLLVWVVAALVHLLPYEFVRREAVYIYDDTIYVAGARSVAEGGGYRYSSFLHEPRIGFYPPLQSWLMAAVWKIWPDFPENRVPLNQQSVAFALAAYTAAYGLWKRMSMPIGVRLGLLGCWMFSPTWNVMLYGLMSDIGFTALVLAVAMLWMGPDESKPAGVGRWVGTLIGLGLAYWWRTAALGFWVAVGLAAFWRGWRDRDWRPAGAFVVASAVVMGGWSWLAQGATGYKGMLISLWADLGGWPGYARLLVENAGACLKGLPVYDTWFNGFVRGPEIIGRAGRWAGWAATLVAGATFLAGCGVAFRGWWARWSEAQMTVLIAILLYFAQMAVMPFSAWQFHRYSFVLMPVLMGWLWWGLSASTWAQARRRWVTWGVVVALGVNIVANVYFLRVHFRIRGETAEKTLSELGEITGWLQTNAAPASRVAVDFSLPHQQVHARTRLPLVVDYLCSKDPWRPLPHSDQFYARADYVLTQGECQASAELDGVLAPAMRSSGGMFRLYRVDAAREAEWRRKTGYPMEGEGQRSGGRR